MSLSLSREVEFSFHSMQSCHAMSCHLMQPLGHVWEPPGHPAGGGAYQHQGQQPAHTMNDDNEVASNLNTNIDTYTGLGHSHHPEAC